MSRRTDGQQGIIWSFFSGVDANTSDEQGQGQGQGQGSAVAGVFLEVSERSGGWTEEKEDGKEEEEEQGSEVGLSVHCTLNPTSSTLYRAGVDD